MASRSGNRFFMKTMGTWACSACGLVPVVSGQTQIVLFDYFGCKAEVFVSCFGACYLSSLTNALRRDRCVVRARVLGVHDLTERSIAAQAFTSCQPEHLSWGLCTDAFCADLLRPRTSWRCGAHLSKHFVIPSAKICIQATYERTSLRWNAVHALVSLNEWGSQASWDFGFICWLLGHASWSNIIWHEPFNDGFGCLKACLLVGPAT